MKSYSTHVYTAGRGDHYSMTEDAILEVEADADVDYEAAQWTR